MTIKPTSNTPRTVGAIIEWLVHNPRFIFVGIVASIVAIPLTCYSGAEKNREVFYQTSPSPTTVVKTGQSSDLQVLFKGTPVTDDVSSIQVSIWNEGRESIKTDNILSKVIRIKFIPPSEILKARVSRVSRPLINFKCQPPSGDTVSCVWDILEKDDGAVIALIYLGTSEDVVVEGDIEGKKPITQAMSPDQVHAREIRASKRLKIWGFIIAGVLGIAAGIYQIYSMEREIGRVEKILQTVVKWVMTLITFAVLLAFIWTSYFAPKSPLF